jgi:pyruvate,water dikinase
VGFGPAFHVRSDEDLVNFPDGGVLIARHSSPKFVLVMRRAQAIVTDAGSATGHMASLAREFSVPSVLDAKVATANIPPGTYVTVDAYSAKVYEGRVEELMALQKPREPHMKGTPVYQALRRVADWIVPLHLVDPKSPLFNPQSCRSLHDIMRFVHEVSYSEMFQISDLVSDHGKTAMKLDAPIPLDLHIIDLGDGLRQGVERGRKVPMERIASVPFMALLKGMMHDDLRTHEPRPVELRGFLSVMSEQMFTSPHVSERFGERSYAIVSDKYLNFSSRVGYHYGVLDSYCGQTVSKNYVTFSFQGGAADDVRRNRRARAIAKILEALGFVVEVKRDRVTARLQKCDRGIVEEKLEMLGRLLVFTRQMDMLMVGEASVDKVAQCFLEGNYHYDPRTLEMPQQGGPTRRASES